MPILLLFTFIAGFVTILAPCIWPLLPIILSASSGGGKKRPLGITLGLMTSFAIFTLSISYLEKIFHIDPNLFRTIAVIAIGLFGLSMMIPYLGMKIEDLINNLTAPFRNRIKGKGTGFSGGYVMGFATGLVWAPCSGPILATVATLAATQEVNARVVMVTLAYVSGLGIPLFLFSLAGSWYFNAMSRFTRYAGRIQQAFGLVMIIAAVLIYTNYDKTVQLKILDIFPSYGNFITKIEDNKQVSEQLSLLQGRVDEKNVAKPGAGELPDLGEAPDFTGIATWLNTPAPLTMRQLRGKVVLVNFWTYTCINCVRELPHVVAWYEKYKNNNFVVIGVHTPEFAFEKETGNVKNAINQFKINYPVAQDNDYKTWRAFDNRYWPAAYLIDVNGRIRKEHFGEGGYEEMELAIMRLLEESGNPVRSTANNIQDEAPAYLTTPETYLGLSRMERFASGKEAELGKHVFVPAPDIPQDHFAYEGAWDISYGSATAAKGSALEIRFRAGKVFLVISPYTKGDQIRLFIDNKAVDDSIAGTDVKDGRLILDNERLYNLIDLKGNVETHLLRLEFESEGVSVYAFTFG